MSYIAQRLRSQLPQLRITKSAAICVSTVLETITAGLLQKAVERSREIANQDEERKQGEEQPNRISEEAIKDVLLDDEEYNIVYTMYAANKTILKHTPAVTVLPVQGQDQQS